MVEHNPAAESLPPLNELSLGAVTPEELEAARRSFFGHANEHPVERVHPVLPDPAKRNILITSALPYVNNVPHLGNIVGCVLSADCFSRYCRLRNYNTVYLCGTDEYGTATETKAMEEGLSCYDLCTKYNKLHKEIYDYFQIDFDIFGRTTTEKHTKIAQDIFMDCYNNGYLHEKTILQFKCLQCDRFLADRLVEGTCPHPGCGYEDARGDQCDKCQKLINATDLIQPRCKSCAASPAIIDSKHLYLDLPHFEQDLKSWYTNSQHTHPWSANACGVMKSWLGEGLEPRCVTRDLKWGTQVPVDQYSDKVLYVWFDAPIGYISITANYTDDWKKWWIKDESLNVELYQFMGKDNVTFHGVIFPGTLMATRQPWNLVSSICSTEYLNYENGKFSKSRNTGVFGNHIKETSIPISAWRFYLLSVRPESQDTSFSWKDLQAVNNNVLCNNLGNFCHRATSFIYKNFDKAMPKIFELSESDLLMIAEVNREISQYCASMVRSKIRAATAAFLSVSKLGNGLLQLNEPWKLLKTKNQQDYERASTVLALAGNLVYLLAILAQPFMPDVAQALSSIMNKPLTYLEVPVFSLSLSESHVLNESKVLFTKIPDELIEEYIARFGGSDVDSTASSSCSPGQAAASTAASTAAKR